jgi:hypothetical protein
LAFGGGDATAQRTLFVLEGSLAEDDIEVGLQFPEFGLSQGAEIDEQRLAGSAVRNTSIQTVSLIHRVALDQQLRRQQTTAIAADSYMNVGCAPWVGDRLDGAKQVPPGRIG